MENIFQLIVSLIEKKMGRYRKPLNASTTLEKNLGISGDDAVELLLEYSADFSVDLTDFDIRKYFLPEGDTILPSLIRSVTGKKNPKQAELTMGDLEKGAIDGKLNDEMISA